MKIVMRHNILRITGNLKTVPVNNRTEIVKLVMACRHSSLPYGTFCNLAVSHNGIYSVIFLVHLTCKSHAYADRKPVSQ